jgi:hypothetical protein
MRIPSKKLEITVNNIEAGEYQETRVADEIKKVITQKNMTSANPTW